MTFKGTVKIHAYVYTYIHICMLPFTEIGMYIQRGRKMSGRTLYMCACTETETSGLSYS